MNRTEEKLVQCDDNGGCGECACECHTDVAIPGPHIASCKFADRKNIGFDLTCGACAGIFYTGSSMGEHTCGPKLNMTEEKCAHSSTPLQCHECMKALVMADPVARAAYWQNRCERQEAALSAIAEALAPEVPVLDRHTLQFVRDRARF